MAKTTPEQVACMAITPIAANLNPGCALPYGLTPAHVIAAMHGFTDFLTFINTQLATKEIERFETMLMPANFSSMVGEFMTANIPKYCPSIVKNRYHNGHPDMVPAGVYPDDMGQHVEEGIEVKASRYLSGWQGHNPEDVWLMVFVFDSNRPVDAKKGVRPKPFRFIDVLCGQLEQGDWKFSGRTEGSRRTITASVRPTGYAKMTANWVYRAPDAAYIEAAHQAE